jgi:putative ABC transport system ATP-binding protein
VSAALDAHRLHRFFHAGDEEILALQGVSLSLEAGELIAVCGPSGSGKSTLLACLAGLDEPDGGTVWIAGERLSRRPEHERARIRGRRVGMLFQTNNMLEHLRVVDNVALGRRLAGRRDRGEAVALLAAVGLAERAGAYPPQLSAGEATRAALAAALANDPAVVLADEPTGELDTANEEHVLALLHDRARGGAAVVVATHSPAVAEIADRALWLRDGEVVDGL